MSDLASTRSRLGDAVLTVLAIAIFARVVYELLAPLVPLLIGMVVFGVIVSAVLRGR